MIVANFDFEPETAEFVRSVEQGPPTEGLSLDQLREGYEATVLANSALVDVEVSSEDLAFVSEGQSIAARLYTPKQTADVGALLLYVHGGGFAVGSLVSHDRLMRLIAAEAGMKVLAIDYRRAPENPYPAALNDVMAAYHWAKSNASSLGIRPDRIALGGESAGATHALMACSRLSKTADPGPALLWVFVPALDPAGTGESHHLFATGAGRTATEFAYLWSLYLPDEDVKQSPEIVSSLTDPTGLPRSFFYTAEFDPARDDGENFAARAKAAGVDISLKRQHGLVHQFPEITGLSPASLAAVQEASKDLAMALS
jgi:acetyl esterase